MRIKLSEEIWKEGGMFIAYCPELDIPACGTSIAKAKGNLTKVIKIQFNEMKKLGTFEENLINAGFDLSGNDEIISLDKKLIEFENIEITA